jgi:chromosome segregation ATPase
MPPSVSSPASSSVPSVCSPSFLSSSSSRNVEFLVRLTTRAISSLQTLQSESSQLRSNLSSSSDANKLYKQKIEQLQEQLQASRYKTAGNQLKSSQFSSFDQSSSSSLTGASVSLEAELASSRHEISELKSQIASLHLDLSHAQSAAHRELLLANSIQTQSRLDEALKQIQWNQMKIQQLQREKEEFQVKFEKKQENQMNQQEDQRELNEMTMNGVESFNKQIQRLKKENLQYENRCDMLESTLQLYQQEKSRQALWIKQLKQEKEEFKHKETGFHEQLQAHSQEVEQLKAQVEQGKQWKELSEIVKLLEREKRELKKKYEIIWSKSVDLENKWEELMEEYKEEKKQKMELQEKVKRIEENKRSDQGVSDSDSFSHLTQQQGEIELLKLKLQEKEKELVQSKKINDTIEKELVLIEQKLTESQLKYKQLEANQHASKEQNASHCDTNNSDSATIEALRKSIEAAEAANNRLEGRLKAQEDSAHLVAKLSAELEAVVAKLQVNEGANEASLTCTICMKFFSGEAITLSPCSHSFDLACFRQLPTEEQDNCPQCQQSIQHDRSLNNSLLSELASRAQFRHQALSGIQQLVQDHKRIGRS